MISSGSWPGEKSLVGDAAGVSVEWLAVDAPAHIELHILWTEIALHRLAPPVHRLRQGPGPAAFAVGARLAFAPRPLLGGLPRLEELGDEDVADLLELLDAGDVSFGPGRGGRQLAHRKVAHIGGELGLQLGDLTTQLPSYLDRLAALVGGIRACRGRRAALHVEHVGAGHQGNRQVARVGARFLAAADRVEHYRLEPELRLGSFGDERAPALLAGDQPLLLQRVVDGAHRIGVNARPIRETADAGQSLIGAEAPGENQGAEAPVELDADRHIAVGADRKRVSLI